MATAKDPKVTDSKADEFWSRFVQPRIAHIQNVSPLGSEKIVEHARQTVDEELDVLHRAMCHLRTRRNALSPTSALPPELLARIFQLSAAIMPVAPDNYTSPRPLGWIYLTHVCRHWRDMALQLHSLWGDISPGLGAEWRRVMLSRAKSMPVTLSLPHFVPDDVDLVSKHLYHTRHLSLSLVTGSDTLNEASQLFESPAAILSSLDLNVTCLSRGNAMLQENLFSGNTPMLRQVHLDGVFLPWSSPIFADLTSLWIHHCCDVRYDLHALQYDQFFDALARMPRLETLHLQHCLPRRSRECAARTNVTPLSCLKQLTLFDTLARCVNVAKHLRVPSSCKLTLNCVQGLEQPIDDLFPFLEGYSQGTEEPCFQTLLILFCSVAHSGRKSVAIKLWRKSMHGDTPTHMLYNKDSDMSLKFPLQSDFPLEALCQVLPLNMLCDLYINGQQDGWSAMRWINMFGRCRAIEHVGVEGEIAVRFCEALVLPVDGSLVTVGSLLTPDQLFLRNLRSLALSNLNFLVHTGSDDMQFIDEFITILRQRADWVRNAIGDAGGGSNVDEVDGKLARLCIWGCTIEKKHVLELQATSVEEVVWDKSEGLYRMEDDSDLEDDESEETGSAGDETDSA